MTKAIFFGLLIGTVIVALIGGWQYSQHYNQDSPTTAVSGILFKTTLNLPEYRNVSSGNDLWGNYHRYTRSDRHTDVLTIYCNKYCEQNLTK